MEINKDMRTKDKKLEEYCSLDSLVFLLGSRIRIEDVLTVWWVLQSMVISTVKSSI